jgi:hypothetical protein
MHEHASIVHEVLMYALLVHGHALGAVAIGPKAAPRDIWH